MANFYQDPNPTSDPDYARVSKEPDRVQADTSLGTLFSGIGNVVDNAGKAATTVFDTTIKEKAQEIAKPIMNRYGADLDVETAKMIAGTGAKGRVRAMQMKNGASLPGDEIDDGSSGPLGFAPADASLVQQQTKGIFDGVDQPRPVPTEMSMEMARLERLKAAYRSGDFSQSAFSAEILAGASKLKARFPGFEDEVDTAFEKITGQNSANAIRKQTMADIQYNQMAALSANSADEKLMNKYRGEISALGYDPDKTPPEVWKPALNKYLGQKTILTGRQLETSVGDPEAARTVADTIALDVRTSLGALSNKAQGDMGLADYTAKIRQMTLNGGGTPREVDETVSQMELTMQAMMTQSRQNLYKPIEGRKDGHSAASLLGPNGDEQITKMLTNQYKPWSDAIALVKSGNLSALQRTTDALKYQGNLDVESLYREFPMARVGAAVGEAFKNDPINANRFSESMLVGWQKAISAGLGNAILNGSTANPAPTPSAAVGAYGPSVNQPRSKDDEAAAATANRDILKQYNMVISPDNKNTPNALHVAKQFFGDQKYYDMQSDSARLKLLMTMGSQEKTAYINRLSESDPEVKEKYDNWMKMAVGDIWRRKSADLQSAITDKRLDIAFNPKTIQFEDGTKYGQDVVSAGWQKSNRENIQSINNAVTMLKPVVGNNPQAILSAIGIDPAAAKQDGVIESVTKAIGTKLNDWRTQRENEDVVAGRKPQTPAKGPDLEPQQTRGVIKGNLSDEQIISMDTQAIPESMSARDFIAKLKRDGKGF